MSEKGEHTGKKIAQRAFSPLFVTGAFLRILWNARKEGLVVENRLELSGIHSSIQHFELLERSSVGNRSARAVIELKKLRLRQVEITDRLKRLEDRMD
jgi:hypothetical protein